MSDRRPFLTARWQHLLMLNFEVDPDCLADLVPTGTELDLLEGRCLASLVAFEFTGARLFGVRIPGYQSFPEVNLRFYVRRWVDGDWRRGVVFIRELVPRRVVVQVARRVFGQNFVFAPMRHQVERSRCDERANCGEFARVHYDWVEQRLECYVSAEIGERSTDAEHAFVAEHYYAYAQHGTHTKHGSRSIEYRVAHPPWVIRRVSGVTCDIHAVAAYGNQIGRWLQAEPRSALFAEGSEVSVYSGEEVNQEALHGTRRAAQPLAPCS
jgi:uncharacterized protein YqjF (DUF2071 family)